MSNEQRARVRYLDGRLVVTCRASTRPLTRWERLLWYWLKRTPNP